MANINYLSTVVLQDGTSLTIKDEEANNRINALQAAVGSH